MVRQRAQTQYGEGSSLERHGRTVALTVNFCGAVAEGAFEIAARLARGSKSTQHWQVEMTQEGRGVATTASVVMGVERETWSHAQARPPKVPPLETLPPMNVEFRILHVRGDVPPVAAATLSTHFLADPAELARQGDRPLRGVADTRAFRHGFHDQAAELWSDDGLLLAVSNQMVWFKS